MKSIILATFLLITSISASAQVFARAPNDAGGEIVLMKSIGGCKFGKMMFTRNPSGKVWYGCWTYSDGYVYARYLNGGHRVYEAADFTFMVDGQVIQGRK